MKFILKPMAKTNQGFCVACTQNQCSDLRARTAVAGVRG